MKFLFFKKNDEIKLVLKYKKAEIIVLHTIMYCIESRDRAT